MNGASPIAEAPVTAQWQRFLADMQSFVADPAPLEMQGRLVRVTGLVLEAAGIRVPVGSVCEVRMPGQSPLQAEVVGFSADCAYLMPTGDVHGLAMWVLLGLVGLHTAAALHHHFVRRDDVLRRMLNAAGGTGVAKRS